MTVRPTIDQVRSVADYATVYNWYVMFTTPPPAMANPPEIGEPNLRCESIDLPNMTDQKVTVQIRGHQVFQSGIHTYNNQLVLNFVETVDNAVKTWIKNWREICWATQTGKHVTKADAEGIIQLHLLDREDNPIWEYTLIGCFLEDYTMGTIDGSTSDAMKPSMTLSYDYFKDNAL
jgi:hypothetical protein